VLNPINPQHTNLVERPTTHALGKLPIERLGRLPLLRLYLRIKPFVLKHLGRTNERHPCRVARLERRYQRQLLARRE